MTTVALVKKMEKKGFVIVPRDEYEKMFNKAYLIDDEPMSVSERRSLMRARKNLKAGKLLSLDEFSRKLGLKNRR